VLLKMKKKERSKKKDQKKRKKSSETTLGTRTHTISSKERKILKVPSMSLSNDPY